MALTPITCLAGKEMLSSARWISPNAFMTAVGLLKSKLWPLPTNAPLRIWLVKRLKDVSSKSLVFAISKLICNRAHEVTGYEYVIGLG